MARGLTLKAAATRCIEITKRLAKHRMIHDPSVKNIEIFRPD